ncbi:MAG: hypothetical protein EBY09_08705 [Verrucomicrobia bacterium]|nr:hypothetical protein [Verrucomicrobiota bacterium]NDD38612.1 hypothetical protein [Verrucomicrobiota bacterium]NDE98439.1 hypothetical protein [Verrucomicrobiota bacterium]
MSLARLSAPAALRSSITLFSTVCNAVVRSAIRVCICASVWPFAFSSGSGGTAAAWRAEIVALARTIDWQIARKRGQIKALAEGVEKEALKASEKAKASVRACVEHPFHIVKNRFRHRKVRYQDWPRRASALHALWSGQRGDWGPGAGGRGEDWDAGSLRTTNWRLETARVRSGAIRRD